MWIVYMKVGEDMWIQVYVGMSCEQNRDYELLRVSVDVCIYVCEVYVGVSM